MANGTPRGNPLRPNDPRALGPYRITARLGRGGMGTVYLADDPQGHPVAVKIINTELADDAAFRARFQREVRSAQRVARFCTAPVIDARLDGEPLFVVTEFVDGPNLAEAVQRDGVMRGATLEGLAVGVASALVAIHNAGVIHRDLKPANVLLSTVGPRVIDFGIARALDTVGDATKTGQLLGTPAYLAPELIAGGEPSPASDIFSWGCLVAYAGEGSAPFDAPTVPAVLYNVAHSEPNLGRLDPALRGLVERALSKDPLQRPSAQDVLNHLVGDTSPDTINRTLAAGFAAPGPAQRPPATGTAWTAPAGTAPQGRPAPVSEQPGTTEVVHASAPEPAGRFAEPPAQAVLPPTHPMPGPQQSWQGPSGGQPTEAWGPRPPEAGPSGPNPALGGPSGPQPPLPGPAAGGRPPGRGGASRRTLLIGGGAVALVLVLVAAAVLVMNPWGPSGPPQNRQSFYADVFEDTDSDWPGSSGYEAGSAASYYGYLDGRYYIREEVDGGVQHVLSPGGGLFPKNLYMEVDAHVEAGPDYAEYGMSCFTMDSDDAELETRYEFLVRVDGQGALIRRVSAAEGTTELATATGVPGLDTTLEASNLLQAACETVDSSVRLRLWVNDEPVLEAVDSEPLPGATDPEGGGTGLLVTRSSGSGDDTIVAFDNYLLCTIEAAE
ncbi:serine/threonine-protein kinase [Allonocardiopsis opalescens]|uniref:Serine/threonine protein kinase n=1 Tax=Allonocardiopsis opalescens TaxID=1144618 RepID=A0A2T0Q0B3_9ACTN|nr:serine/threonine-protein kinase [Allonocardiopsis opalescens]PRX97239.1 serine/threonine protein kinase [Allonocardiopsis opalescens]